MCACWVALWVCRCGRDQLPERLRHCHARRIRAPCALRPEDAGTVQRAAHGGGRWPAPELLGRLCPMAVTLSGRMGALEQAHGAALRRSGPLASVATARARACAHLAELRLGDAPQGSHLLQEVPHPGAPPEQHHARVHACAGRTACPHNSLSPAGARRRALHDLAAHPRALPALGGGPCGTRRLRRQDYSHATRSLPDMHEQGIAEGGRSRRATPT